MTNCCKSCGQPLPGIGGLTIDNDRMEIRYGGKAINGLTPSHFRLVRLLAQKAGRVVTKDQVLDALYWDKHGREREADPKIVDVFICKIRPKVSSIGLTIRTHWGKGYELLIPDVKPAEDHTVGTSEVAALSYGAMA